MSRSYKKIPVFGTVALRSSEKEDKRLANRIFRRVSKNRLQQDREDAFLPLMREVSDVWSFRHDGKRYRRSIWLDSETEIDLFFNPSRNYRHDFKSYKKDSFRPKIMRK